MQGVLQRSDIDVKFKVMTDSSTAKSISQRLGVGKLRSIEIRTLWIQEIFQKKELHIAKVPGSENFSDIGTEPLSARVLYPLLKAMNFRGIGDVAVDTVDSVSVVSSGSNVQGMLLKAVEALCELVRKMA